MSATTHSTPLWKIGKYLLPKNPLAYFAGRTTAGRCQTSIEELAASSPQSVSLTRIGNVETLPQFDFASYTEGQLTRDQLAEKLSPAPWVAQLQGGHSIGRHCLAMTADGAAVRETGFNLDMVEDPERFSWGRHNLRRRRYRREGDLTCRRSLPRVEHITGRVATLNTVCSHNFYHWMVDILPRWATLQRAGQRADYYLVDCQSGFQRRVLNALGIANSQLIQPHCGLNLQAEELLVPSKRSPECLRELGNRLRAGLLGEKQDTENFKRGRRLFISRRQAATRKLSNEVEFDAYLTQRGFETHCFEDYDLSEQCHLVSEAETIVATHGAGLANLMFARPGTRVIEIVPAGRYNADCYPRMSRIFGLDHTLLFAKRARHKQILTVSLDDTATALEAAFNTVRRSQSQVA